MATYAIGDLQGCFAPFMRLLETLQFDEKKDFLWLTGDLINRGPQSLETLRFVASLEERVISVLGNHDLTLLAVASGTAQYDPQHHTFEDILNAPDRSHLIHWLKQCPLMHHDPVLGYTLVHAGFHPQWDLLLALSLAQEIETVLQGASSNEFLTIMYGNKPNQWSQTLKGWDRLRFIVNCFTRIRFCTPQGELEFDTKESAHFAPSGYLPWFAIPNRLTRDLKIVFGHWASLQGESHTPGIYPLDTGCVWGNCLTALRLDDGQLFSESCKILV